MARPHVVISAADPSLRESILFLMASENIMAVAYPDVETALASPHARISVCAIVDDETAIRQEEVIKRIQLFGKPVVLLASVLTKVPHIPQIVPLSKPFLGKLLLEAVGAIIEAASKSST